MKILNELYYTAFIIHEMRLYWSSYALWKVIKIDQVLYQIFAEELKALSLPLETLGEMLPKGLILAFF